MPSSSYRRKLRKPIGQVSKYIVPAVILNAVISNTTHSCDSELVIIQKYFYKVLDDIILYNDFTSNVSVLHSILAHTKSIIDFHKLIDRIQNTLLSVVCNISNSVHSNIIQTRIDHIKTCIDALPEGCLNLSPLSDMVLQLIHHIVTTMDFSGIHNNINEIQLYINQKYNTDTSHINTIHDTILSIICNIGQNTNTSIINERILYLRQIIAQL
jgi:hypothetical protein